MSLRPNKYRVAVGVQIALEQQASQAMALPSTAGERAVVLDRWMAGLARSTLPALDAIDVALAYPYARHAVLPWQDAVLAPAARNAYAEAMLAEEYGWAAADWHCTLAQESFGEPGIASALRRDIVDEIAAAAKKHRLHVRHIRPLLIDAIARHRGALPGDAVFMTRQPDACEFAFRQGARWRHAFTLRNDGKSPAQCLMAAALLAQHFPQAVYIDGVAVDGVEGNRAEI